MRDSTEIIFVSWLVNSVVPAKLGEVYRAWLLKVNYPVSLSATFGTIFIERIFDIFAIVILGLGAAFWSFRTGLDDTVRTIMFIGIVVVIVLAVGAVHAAQLRASPRRAPAAAGAGPRSSTSASRKASSRPTGARCRWSPC